MIRVQRNILLQPLKHLTMKKSILFLLPAVLCLGQSLFSQQPHVYPTNWYVGMKDPKVQLMVHREKIGDAAISLRPYAGVKLTRRFTPDNHNYQFVDLDISPSAKAGDLILDVREPGGGRSSLITYELRARSTANGKTRAQGVNSSDLIWLVMPDRFSNGDTTNDRVTGYLDQLVDRSNKYAHHGGDFQGVVNHLDYLKSWGVTTVWMTPVIENDMPLEFEVDHNASGYHGYWFTDHYAIDKRYGGNVGYAKMIEATHAKGMKVIQDAVYNHVGIKHWFVQDEPMKDWLNHFPTYTPSNHREELFTDPYASAKEKETMIAGWFTPHLPDVNLKNPYLARFLIQHALWTTEYFGIDGWRVDTYKYCYEPFMNEVNAALEREFPGITIFGEAWSNTQLPSAYFSRNNINAPFKHNLQGVCDFPLTFAMQDAVNQPVGWTSGISRVYMTLSADLLYKDPKRNCIFLDNHDMDRIFSVVEEDLDRFKMDMGMLLTLRGIPQVYYGTEILMKNKKTPNDAEVRYDFPGGFAGDALNKFTTADRTPQENEAFNYVSAIANWRKSATAIHTGKTMQFIPQDGLYVYFRYNEKQTVMCLVNTSAKERKPDLPHFSERITGFTKGMNVADGKAYALDAGFTVPAKTMLILDLGK
jgi:glycosidase